MSDTLTSNLQATPASDTTGDVDTTSGIGPSTNDTSDFSRAGTITDTSNLDAISNHILGAQLASQDQGDGTSLTDSIGKFASTGVPLIGASIFNSFYNTAASVGNVFGADIDKATIASEFGENSDSTNYYNQNTNLIEGAGLVIGSFLPGLGATKLLKLAQAGKFGETLAASTGLFSGIRDEAIASATVDLAGNTTGASLFGLNTANKFKAILGGLGDQALQGAVFQTATLATMHASPILQDQTVGEMVSGVADSALGFGLVGGLFDGLGAVTQINKAVRTADIASKAEEITGASGIGNLTPGDRIVNLSSAFDQAASATPEADRSLLQSRKLQYNQSTTDDLIRRELTTAAGGDKDVANAVHNFITSSRDSGQLTPDTLNNLFGQLSDIGRHGDIDVSSIPQNVFYVPKSIDQSLVSQADHDNLMHLNRASANNPLAKALELNDPNTLPTIARATDTGLLPPATPGATPSSFPLYSGAMDAYANGVDLFVDAKGGVHINPGSQVFKEVPVPGQSRVLTAAEKQVYQATGNLPADSGPLNAVGLTLDLKSGTLFGESPLPVVGDIALPKLVGNGLQVGEKFWPQSVGKPLTVDTAPMDANTRYVWALQRGIKSGDAIASTDLPMLEQLYREQAAGNAVLTNKSLTTFTDGTPIPSTAPEMLQHIADVKQSMLPDLLAAGKNADEIGHILNAPQEGLSTQFASSDPTKIMMNTADHQTVNHVRLAYDIGTTKNQEGNLLRGAQMTEYRTQLARTANADAVSNYLAKTAGPGQTAQDMFQRLQFTKGVGDADILGSGAGFFTNANAEYGTLAQQSERIGRAAQELNLQRQAEVSGTLASAANTLRKSPDLAAEVGNFINVRHSTGENYVAIPDDVAAKFGLGKNTVMLEGAVSRDETGAMTIDKSYVPPGFVPGGTAGGKLNTYYNLSDEALAWEKANQTLNNNRNELRNQWWQSQGISKKGYNPDVLYAPPVNTSKFPFFAYVRQREGTALGESGAGIITARSADELQQKISMLSPEYDAFTKSESEAYFKAKNEYDFNRSFQTGKVNTELARKGLLNNGGFPEVRADNIINDWAGWHFNQERHLLTDHIELHNAQIFAQLRAMGSRFNLTGTSKFGLNGLLKSAAVSNPYESYIRTALGIGSKGQYPLWDLAQEKLQAFGDTAFNAVRDAFGATRKGILPVEQAAKVAEKFGLGNPYGEGIEAMKKYYGGMANQLPDPRLMSKFTATANSALGATVIRLDTFQQLIHAATTPIMAAMEYTAATGSKQGLSDLLSISTPTGTKVPGFLRVFYRAVKNFATDDGTLAAQYSGVGKVPDELKAWRGMVDNFSMPLGQLSQTGWAQKIEQGTNFAQKLVGTNFVNRFNHFILSDIGRQIGEAAGHAGQDLSDTIGTFVNRSLGNMAAGQRAAIFSGPVGGAVGLFQSYQMNLMQQLFRHIGNGDVRALAVGAGMQSSIFGLSSLPGFSALNNLIADRPGNPSHSDIYSGASQALGKPISDYLLYGSLSGILGTSLYDRGDLNPRRASILPVNPLNFPSVAAGVRLYDTLSQLGQRIAKGAPVPASLLLAAEHNGLSRPLAGVAELMQGFSTAPNGDLLAALTAPQNQTSGYGQQVSGYSDLFSMANMSRILGAKPLDEGIATDLYYRSQAAKTLDRARLQELGQVAKTSLYDGSEMAPQQVTRMMVEYAKAGGVQTNFNQWLLSQAKDANTSILNKTFMAFKQPMSQTVQRVMGGVPIPDFRNQSSGLQDASTDTGTDSTGE